MIFKRRKNTGDDGAAADRDATTEETGEETPEDAVSAGVPNDGSRVGPFDLEDAPEHEHYIDLGALKVEPVEGMQLRLEVEEGTQRVVAAALELDGSRLQLQVFAAPKSGGLWEGIAAQIEESIIEQGGKIDSVEGRFGTELIARVPSEGPDGTAGYMVARFIGIDGGRWFLRGVLGGPATLDRAQAERLEDRLSRVIIDRGDQPMPPAELLPLTMPSGAVATPDRQEVAEPGAAERSDNGDRPAGRPERGPEITEIG